MLGYHTLKEVFIVSNNYKYKQTYKIREENYLS